MKNITGLIATYNGEKFLDECLSSLSFCDEIVVIDSYSTDKTEEICKKHNVRFLQNPFVRLKDQFEFALKHIENDWVVVLDQDEMLTAEAIQSIQNFFNTTADGIAENNNFSGAFVPRRSYFFNQFMKHSDSYPDYLLRLFKKSDLYIKSSGVHHEFNTDGKTTKLSGDIIHYPYTSFSHYVKKLDSYADFGAKEKTGQGKKFSLTTAILHSLWGFLRIYFYKKGFLDGKAGFIMATHHAFYVYMKYIRIGENADTFGTHYDKH